ncbi:MAG: hypothetical protein FJ316_10210 [SAR202 cluster bacterium]|nr:hypothetical protein [SAR202 cluster bacterium]
MPEPSTMSRETFLLLAQQAGLDIQQPRMAELYAYVQGVLSSIAPLHGLNVGDVEPDMVFNPLEHGAGS